MKTVTVAVMLVCLLALGVMPAATATSGDPNFRNLKIEGIVKPEDIKKTADFVVEAADRVNAVFTSYSAKVDGLLAEMNGVSGEVVQAVNTWMSEPSEENKTRVREIVTDGALRIKTASEALAAESPKIAEVVQLARTNIKSKVDETTKVAARISDTLTSLSQQRETLLTKMKQAYERLSTDGASDKSAEMSPEVQEELAKLKTDWIELNFIADQWAGKGKRMQTFAETMSRASSRFDSVERMVRIAGYQASSFARMASAIGGQGADDIPLEMWEKTFGELTKFEEAIVSSSERFASVPFDLGQLRDAGNASWAQQDGQVQIAQVNTSVDGTPLLAWLKETVDGNTKEARLSQK